MPKGTTYALGYFCVDINIPSSAHFASKGLGCGMTNPTNSELKNERKNTDVSLIAERIKATESLKSVNGKAQTQTDQLLNHERALADAKTANSREENDQLREVSDSQDMSHEKSQLAKERKITDQATKDERSQADKVIDQEREMADKLVGHVLDLERKVTDKNLSTERASTDTHLKGVSASLKSEIAEHTITKSNLTSREELLAIVSHDLRNPVGVASSYAQLILDMDGVDDNLKSFANTIKRNADSALRLISDLMDMERFSQHKWQFQVKDCSGEKLILQTIENFSNEAKEKKIKLISALSSPLKDFSCDHDRLMQVLSNLMTNALKFTPDHGVVTLNAKLVDDNIQFCVCDTGPGIPISQQKQVFERFAQLQSKDRTGLGLGLYISKTLIEELGGQMWLESIEGQGSSFFFSLPVE